MAIEYRWRYLDKYTWCLCLLVRSSEREDDGILSPHHEHSERCRVHHRFPVVSVNVMSLDPGTISEGQQICAGGDPDPLYTDVPPSGEGALSYQWQETTDLSESWVDIPGANGLNYNPPGPVLETTFYQLVVTNTIGVVSCTEFTEPVVVEVYDDPEFLIQPWPSKKFV